MPTRCNDCHNATRPSTPTHLSGAGAGDCVGCHTYPDWAAAFQHVPAVPGCTTCHAGVRPSNGLLMSRDPALRNSDSHYGPADCYTCHEYAKGWRDWDDESTAHYNAAHQPMKACMPCHYNKGWSKHRGHANWFTPPLYDIANSDAYPPDGTGKLGNCYSCHKVRRRSWSE